MTGDVIDELTAERDVLRAERDSMLALVDRLTAENAALTSERDSAKSLARLYLCATIAAADGCFMRCRLRVRGEYCTEVMAGVDGIGDDYLMGDD